MVGQRLTIEAASALEVRYKYEGKKYRAWFVGWEYRVHAPNSPVTDALTGKVENAAERWKRGDRRRAASQLREVIDMTRVDDACRMAYLSVRDTIPSALVSKAKWLRWRPYIVAAALAAGIVFVSLLVIGVRSAPRAKTAAPHAPPTKAERDKAKTKRP
ncbi:unnamed protein product [Gemmata massiliana]|uniref:Uncharacterized protein n=1 Tax=Gemmata massiliana TaxID=1210884 RepID=A0A6P2DHF7_9BACT|nr:hypothetical protein [Gemmata massiliana]VTS01350.1 unnamed protein product [Gemmata massiliana]